MKGKKLSRAERPEMPLAALLFSLVAVCDGNNLLFDVVLAVPDTSPVGCGVSLLVHGITSEEPTTWTASAWIVVELKQLFALTGGNFDRSSVKTMSAH